MRLFSLHMGPSLALPLVILLLPPVLLADFVTVDDSAGVSSAGNGSLPQYARGFWAAVCEDCENEGLAGVDWTQVHNRSLHLANGIANWTMSLSFHGSGVVLFFVIYQSHNTSLNFYLDGSSNSAGSYQHLAHSGTSASPLYNEMVFDVNNLPDGPHTVLMNAPDSTLFAFDSAVYWSGAQPGVIPLPPVGSVETSEIGSATSSSTGGAHGGPSGTPHRPTSTEGHPGGSSVASHDNAGTVSPVRRSHSGGPNLAVALGISIPGITVIVALGFWYSRRRRSRTRAGETSQQHPDGGDADDDAIVPFYATPDASPSAPDVKDAKLLAGDEAVLGAANEDSWQAQSAANTASSPAPADIALTRLEAELARMHAQYEMLRRVAEPPPYSNGDRSSRGQSDTAPY